MREAPPAIYPIADLGALESAGTGHLEGASGLQGTALEMARAGAEWVQVRAKGLDDRQLFSEVRGLCDAARSEAETRRLRIWVNDRPDVAALLPVAGVHLGQDDLPPRSARQIVGPDVWIGRSTHDEEQFKAAAADPDVDVIALGPIFRTASKEDAAPAVGLELLAEAREWTDKPIVAIGGVDEGNVRSVLDAGADSAAVLGAACRRPVAASLRRLLRAAANDSDPKGDGE